ncbi:tight adherence protein C [Succiniclasticum ruminis]|uniref:Tight adherence protein C n=1 Tax=Succiniclasticum ruminis TaxID=40841 RepID=A0A1G6I4T0_9FIRM|nr:type II secretion system F family protein [Succiniclasticum ruminis]SDC00736.1 tight adherence protein C [Succiniclasticum ruminis]
MVLLISLLTAFLVFSILYYVIKTKVVPDNQVHQRLRNLQGGEGRVITSHTDELAQVPFLDRTVVPLLRKFENFMVRFAPSGIHDTVEQKLMLAGLLGKWSANGFITVWLISMAIFFGIAYIVITKKTMSYTQSVLFAWLCVMVGALLPFSTLNSAVRKRQKAIDKQLPEVLDLLSVSVRAGLSFDGALRKITDRMAGPLIDEFKRMQQDVRMGTPRARALQAMAKRCDVEDLYLFITSVIQAERLGTSMGRTLDNQADNMRERRRQKAKAEALKAPVKIVFPLVIFIFPAIFVVVLLPSIFSLMHSLGGK